jgi:hypothetical protein
LNSYALTSLPLRTHSKHEQRVHTSFLFYSVLPLQHQHVAFASAIAAAIAVANANAVTAFS